MPAHPPRENCDGRVCEFSHSDGSNRPKKVQLSVMENNKINRYFLPALGSDLCQIRADNLFVSSDCNVHSPREPSLKPALNFLS